MYRTVAGAISPRGNRLHRRRPDDALAMSAEKVRFYPFGEDDGGAIHWGLRPKSQKTF